MNEDALAATRTATAVTQHPPYSIRPYDDALAAALAVMWNESDDGWPGTFTHGNPYTAERVKRWMKESDPLLRLVVCHEDGRVVGYGDLEDAPHLTGQTCYVPLLNIHPDHRGRSLCRHMLTRMVDHAVTLGYDRMTIGTWSGNIQSVPLYKKVGFFWTPGSAVRMENYVPAIRRLTVAGDFFAAVNWYRDYQRALTQVPDEQRHPEMGDMKVYINRWEHNGRFLEVIVDREGQSITGVATESLSVFAVVGDSNPAIGIRYPVQWIVENKGAHPLPIRLTTDADSGITVEGTADLRVDPGSRVVVDGTFCVTTEAPPLLKTPRWEALPRPRLYTHLQVGSQPLTLATGLNYRPPIELTLLDLPAPPLPRHTRKRELQLRNRLSRPLAVTVNLSLPTGWSADWTGKTISLKADSFAALPLHLTAAENGGGMLTASVTLDYEGQSITTPARHLPLLALAPGHVAALEINAGQDSHALHIANDFYTLTAVNPAGRVKLRSLGDHNDNFWFREEVGPPFEPHDLEKKFYQMSLDAREGVVTARFEVQSTRFPDLIVRRTVTATGGPLLTIQHQLLNNSDGPLDVTVLTRTGYLDLDLDNGEMTLPHPGGPVISSYADGPSDDRDYPRSPDDVPAHWSALTIDGNVYGHIWPASSSEQRFRWRAGDIKSAVCTLSAGETATLPPLYYYCGPGDWRTIRRLWQRLNGVPAARHRVEPEALPDQRFEIAPNPIVLLEDESTAVVDIMSDRATLLNGALTVAASPDWTVSPTQIPVTDLNRENPAQTTLHIASTNAIPHAAAAVLQLRTPTGDATKSLPLLRLGDGNARVQVDFHPQENTWQLANGRQRWLVAPAYHGGVVAWHDEGSPVNHLLTNYPAPDAPFGEFAPWFGGIQPSLRRHAEDWEQWPGPYHRLAFATKQALLPDERGLPWQGVTLTAFPTDDAFAGMSTAVDYLTLPGSNVLKLRLTVINASAVTRTAVPGFQLFGQPDGSFTNSELLTEGRIRRRTDWQQWCWHGPWSAIHNPDSGRTLTVVSAADRPRTFWMDWSRDGAYLMVEQLLQVGPKEQGTLTAYAILSDNPAAAPLYGALRSLR